MGDMKRPDAWWMNQIDRTLQDMTSAEETAEIFHDWAKRWKAYLQTIPGQMAPGLTPEERVEAARYLYWNIPQLQAKSIAFDLLGLEKMCELQDVIGSTMSTITCNRCGEPIAVTSRSDLDTLRRQQRKASPRYAEGYDILCPSCHQAIMEEREKEYEQHRETIVSRVQELKAMPYQEYLQTPEWQERRKKHLKSANYRCQVCNTPGSLDVHHRTYDHRGEERYQDLIALCRPCHELFHKQGKLNT